MPELQFLPFLSYYGKTNRGRGGGGGGNYPTHRLGLMLTFIEMSDKHPIVSSPIIIKYKYKLANQEAISFN